MQLYYGLYPYAFKFSGKKLKSTLPNVESAKFDLNFKEIWWWNLVPENLYVKGHVASLYVMLAIKPGGYYISLFSPHALTGS